MDAAGASESAASATRAAQVVGADGEMDVAAMEQFAAAAGLQGTGISYAVVSILGPQGSGTYVSRVILPCSSPASPFPSASSIGVLRRPRWVLCKVGIVNGFRHSFRMNFSCVSLPSCQLLMVIDRRGIENDPRNRGVAFFFFFAEITVVSSLLLNKYIITA
jgi:hypothetical protein